MKKNDFYEFFYTFAICPKMYEFYFISLGSEVKTDQKKPWNNGKYDLFLWSEMGTKNKFYVKQVFEYYCLILSCFSFFYILSFLTSNFQTLRLNIVYSFTLNTQI